MQDLETHLFGNPHSQHGWSGNEGSAQAVAEARQLTLEMCNAPLGEYECIFTSGATGVFHCARSAQLVQSVASTRHVQCGNSGSLLHATWELLQIVSLLLLFACWECAMLSMNM